jgi:hypothetical protein
VLSRAGDQRSSHFLVADAAGNAFGTEFAGGRRAELRPERGVLLHTNHCLSSSLEGVMLPTSMERYEMAGHLLKRDPGRSLEAMRHVLSDVSCGNDSILSPYHPEQTLGGLEVGTCATVLMDLPARRMYLRKGPSPSAPFSSHAL